MARPELDEPVDLGAGDQRALRTHRLRRVDREIEHVAAAEQAFRAAHVEDRARVDLRRHGERDARGNVRLDDAGDHVDRRPLRCDDQVDTGRARELRQTADQGFDFARRDEHQVGELVDHDHDVGQLVVGILGVPLFDLAHAGLRKPLVALIHLFGHLEERAGRHARIGDYRVLEMRDAVVDAQLDALGIDHHHLHLVGRRAHEQRCDDAIQTHRLAAAGRAGNEQMRHLAKVAVDRAAGDVFAQRHVQGRDRAARRHRFHDLAHGDDRHGGVRNLDADG